MKKISFIFGTRPEAIKLAPVIRIFKQNSGFDVNICVTAQHRQMLDQVLNVFNIIPDVDLNLMEHKQTLSSFFSKALTNLDDYFKSINPDLLFIQGDTTTVLVAAMAAFYNNIKIAHVEAGLRTYDKLSPFPEEINRVLTSHLADLHFAPTKRAKKNLIKEGVCKDKIFVTGNTVIDSLLYIKEQVENDPPDIPGLNNNKLISTNPIVLITAHRRENFGKRFIDICNSISKLARLYPEHQFIFPVHLNPNVRKPVNEILSKKRNVHLIEPLGYIEFIYLMTKSKIIITDSGGLQEEAPSLGKFVLVLRDVTERPEALDTGLVKLVGTDTKKIIQTFSYLIRESEKSSSVKNIKNPFGNGTASKQIFNITKKLFN